MPGARYAAGQRLAVQRCDGKQDQEFLRKSSGAGSGSQNQEIAPYGDGRLCVGMPHGIKAGAAVVLSACNGSTAQAWAPMYAWYQWGGAPVGLYPYPLGASGLALAPSRLTGTSAQAVTEPVRMWDMAQSWLPKSSPAGGKTHVTFRLAGRTDWCLDAPSATAVTVQSCDGSSNQEFSQRLVNSGGAGYEQLEPVAETGLCLSRTAGSGSVPVALKPCSASDTSEMWGQG